MLHPTSAPPPSPSSLLLYQKLFCLSSPVSSYAQVIHINRYMSHLPLRSPGNTRVVCIRLCLYCTLPTPLPALRPTVSSVAAEIDKLTLKALCLRSLLEWEKNTTCLQQQSENTLTAYTRHSVQKHRHTVYNLSNCALTTSMNIDWISPHCLPWL